MEHTTFQLRPGSMGYLLGKGVEEANRLDALDAVYGGQSDEWMNRITDRQVQKSGQEGTLRVLDVGCGNGAWTVRYAQQHPNVTVFAADIAQEQLKLTRQLAERVDVRLGDRMRVDVTAHEVREVGVLTLEGLNTLHPNGFDIVHCRALLTNVPNAVEVADRLLTLVKPGGRLVMEEYGVTDDVVVSCDGQPLPPALKAWDVAIRVQHVLQGSNLGVVQSLFDHFMTRVQSGDNRIKSITLRGEPRCEGSDRALMTLFTEGVRRAVKKMEQIPGIDQLPRAQNPIKAGNFKNGQDWIRAADALALDPEFKFSLPGMRCIEVKVPAEN